MLASRKMSGMLMFLNSIVLFAFLLFLTPDVSRADSFLVFYKEDVSSLKPLQPLSAKTEKQSVTLRLNENGDMVVRYGLVNMVFAYCPPEDPHKQHETINLAMALPQEVPAMNGVSIRLNFTF